jgi:hypothetical protein
MSDELKARLAIALADQDTSAELIALILDLLARIEVLEAA